MTAVPDPALDGPDAELAMETALTLDSPHDPAVIVSALNEQGVVLCDEVALIELRRQAKAHSVVQSLWPSIAAWQRANATSADL